MVAERISHHDTPSEDPDDMGDVTPIRSSEGKLILEKLKTVAEGVMELQTGQGRILGEISNNAARTHLLTEEVSMLRTAIAGIPAMKDRIDSMRPKVDSVPVIVEGIFKDKQLSGLLEEKADRKMLRFEIWKAVIAVVVAGALGVVSTVVWQGLLYAAGHQKPVAHAAP